MIIHTGPERLKRNTSAEVVCSGDITEIGRGDRWSTFSYWSVAVDELRWCADRANEDSGVRVYDEKLYGC